MDKLGCSWVYRDMVALVWISYIAFWCTEICVYISQSHKYLYLHPLWTSQVTASPEVVCHYMSGVCWSWLTPEMTVKSLLLLCFLFLDVQSFFSYLAWPSIIFKVGLFLEPSLGSQGCCSLWRFEGMSSIHELLPARGWGVIGSDIRYGYQGLHPMQITELLGLILLDQWGL